MRKIERVLKIFVVIVVMFSFNFIMPSKIHASGIVKPPTDKFVEESGQSVNLDKNLPDGSEKEKGNLGVEESPEKEGTPYKGVTKPSSINDIINAGSQWIEQGQSQQGNLTVDYFGGMFVSLGQVLVAVGVVAVLIVTAVMAIKWITAKPDQQAKLKQQLIGLVVSVVVIFGAVGIWRTVKGIMEDVEEELQTSQSIKVTEFAQVEEKYNEI